MCLTENPMKGICSFNYDHFVQSVQNDNGQGRKNVKEK